MTPAPPRMHDAAARVIEPNGPAAPLRSVRVSLRRHRTLRLTIVNRTGERGQAPIGLGSSSLEDGKSASAKSAGAGVSRVEATDRLRRLCWWSAKLNDCLERALIAAQVEPGMPMIRPDAAVTRH
jgi:hypothetical protein